MMFDRPHFTYIFATPNQTINREAAATAEREREIRLIVRPIVISRVISHVSSIPRPIILRPIWHSIWNPQPVWRPIIIERPLPTYEEHSTPSPHIWRPLPVAEILSELQQNNSQDEVHRAEIPARPPSRVVIEPISKHEEASTLSKRYKGIELHAPHPIPLGLPQPNQGLSQPNQKRQGLPLPKDWKDLLGPLSKYPIASPYRDNVVQSNAGTTSGQTQEGSSRSTETTSGSSSNSSHNYIVNRELSYIRATEGSSTTPQNQTPQQQTTQTAQPQSVPNTNPKNVPAPAEAPASPPATVQQSSLSSNSSGSSGGGGGIFGFFSSLASDITNALSDVGNAISNAVTGGSKNVVATAATTATPATSQQSSRSNSNNSGSGSGIFGFFSGLASDVVNGLTDIGKAVSNTVGTAVNDIKNAASTADKDIVTGLADIGSAVTNAARTVDNGIKNVASTIGNKVTSIVNDIKSTAGTVKNDIVNALGAINNAIQSAYAAAYGTSNNISQEKQQLTQEYQQELSKIQQEKQQVQNEYNQQLSQIQQAAQQVQAEYQQELAQIQQEMQQVQAEYQQLSAQYPNSPQLNQWYETQMQQLQSDLQSLNQWYNTQMEQLQSDLQSLNQWYNSSMQKLNSDEQSLNQWYNSQMQQLNKSQGGGNPFQTALTDIADLSALVGYYATEGVGGAVTELGDVLTGRGLVNFSQAVSQFNKAGGQNIARAVGDVTEVVLPAVVTAIAAPELLPAVIIGEASSVGLGEAISKLTTGQFQPLNQVLLEANEGGVLGALGELGGLALESGLARGAGALTKLVTGSEEAASKVSELTPVWRGIGGALTNAGIQWIFTPNNPEQIGIAALIGGLAGGLGPGIAGKILSKIDEMRGTGVIAEPEVFESPLTGETVQGWKAVLPNGDVIHLVPRTTFGEGSVRGFVNRYVGEVGDNNLIAHSTTAWQFYGQLANGKVVEVQPVGGGTGAWEWRNWLKFQDMYWSPGEGPDEAVALTAYGGLADTRPSIPEIRLRQSSVRDVIYRFLHPFEKGGIVLSNADIELGPRPPGELVDFVKSMMAKTGSMNRTAEAILNNPRMAQMLQDWRSAVETYSAERGVVVPGSEDLMGLSHERQVVLAPGTKLKPTGEVYNIWVRKTPRLFENLPGPLRDILSDWVKMKAVYVDILPGEPTNLPDFADQNNTKVAGAGKGRDVDVDIEDDSRRDIEESEGRDMTEREIVETLVRELSPSMLRGYEEDIIRESFGRDIRSPPQITQDVRSPPRDVNPPRSPPPPSRIEQPTRDEITSPPRGSYSPPPRVQQITNYQTQQEREEYEIQETPQETYEQIEEYNMYEQSQPPPVFEYQSPVEEGSIPMGPPPLVPTSMPGGFGGGGGNMQEISGMAGEVITL